LSTSASAAKMIQDDATVQERLAKAEEQLAAFNRCVTGQREMVAHWEQRDRDTTLARELLSTFERLQALQLERRNELLNRVQAQEAA